MNWVHTVQTSPLSLQSTNHQQQTCNTICDQSCHFFWRLLRTGHCVSVIWLTYMHKRAVVQLPSSPSDKHTHIFILLTKRGNWASKMNGKWGCRMWNVKRAQGSGRSSSWLVGTQHNPHRSLLRRSQRNQWRWTHWHTSEQSRRPRPWPGASYKGTKRQVRLIRNRERTQAAPQGTDRSGGLQTQGL